MAVRGKDPLFEAYRSGELKIIGGGAFGNGPRAQAEAYATKRDPRAQRGTAVPQKANPKTILSNQMSKKQTQDAGTTKELNWERGSTNSKEKGKPKMEAQKVPAPACGRQGKRAAPWEESQFPTRVKLWGNL